MLAHDSKQVKQQLFPSRMRSSLDPRWGLDAGRQSGQARPAKHLVALEKGLDSPAEQ